MDPIWGYFGQYEVDSFPVYGTVQYHTAYTPMMGRAELITQSSQLALFSAMPESYSWVHAQSDYVAHVAMVSIFFATRAHPYKLVHSPQHSVCLIIFPVASLFF